MYKNAKKHTKADDSSKHGTNGVKLWRWQCNV